MHLKVVKWFWLKRLWAQPTRPTDFEIFARHITTKMLEICPVRRCRPRLPYFYEQMCHFKFRMMTFFSVAKFSLIMTLPATQFFRQIFIERMHVTCFRAWGLFWLLTYLVCAKFLWRVVSQWASDSIS